ncbi:MAG: peptide deformylase [Parachlamydiales bacterium]|nr:peptide deformylase [Parachlamydiales bacterium]
MELPIAYFGDTILRKKAKPVEAVDDELRKFVEDMFETMDKNDGAGLAAVQVHRDMRLFISRIDTWNRDGTVNLGTPLVFINPVLTDPSPEMIAMEEGCLSLPGIRGMVLRPAEVTVEATDLNGNRFKERYTGIQARCCMHENDHINGVLMIDRFSPRERKMVDAKLRLIKKKKR